MHALVHVSWVCLFAAVCHTVCTELLPASVYGLRIGEQTRLQPPQRGHSSLRNVRIINIDQRAARLDPSRTLLCPIAWWMDLEPSTLCRHSVSHSHACLLWRAARRGLCVHCSFLAEQARLVSLSVFVLSTVLSADSLRLQGGAFA